MKRLIAAAIIAGSMSSAAASDTLDVYMTGDDLLAECRTSLLFCTGYALAIVDVLNAGDVIAGWGACPPHSEVTYEEIVGVIVRFLNDNPDRLHEAAVVLSATAFNEAFACDNF